MPIQAPKGTRDILPSKIHRWQALERLFSEVSGDFGYKQIRTPVFEYTEIFDRGVGETTDIVQKEMYTFEDKGGRSITLRPEGTAGIVRSYIENGLSSSPSPVKLSYCITAYRYENVSKGRYREFHQFGAEAFGSKDPMIDAEMISLVDTFFEKIGISKYDIEINSIGCPRCRPQYNKELKEFFAQRIDGMCPTCAGRFAVNPLRILDCKERECIRQSENAPVMLDHVCDECAEHFALLKKYLDNLGIRYRVNKRIVRGLDYYTKTVFEFISDDVGTQGTICGGGRYDDLIDRFGGGDIPGTGFALGVERLLMQIEAENAGIGEEKKPSIFIASVGDEAKLYASRLCLELRKDGVFAECDTMQRSIRAQLKYADRIGAAYVAVIGDDELSGGSAALKEMATGESRKVLLVDIHKEIMKMEEQ